MSYKFQGHLKVTGCWLFWHKLLFLWVNKPILGSKHWHCSLAPESSLPVTVAVHIVSTDPQCRPGRTSFLVLSTCVESTMNAALDFSALPCLVLIKSIYQHFWCNRTSFLLICRLNRPHNSCLEYGSRTLFSQLQGIITGHISIIYWQTGEILLVSSTVTAAA